MCSKNSFIYWSEKKQNIATQKPPACLIHLLQSSRFGVDSLSQKSSLWIKARPLRLFDFFNCPTAITFDKILFKTRSMNKSLTESVASGSALSTHSLTVCFIDYTFRMRLKLNTCEDLLWSQMAINRSPSKHDGLGVVWSISRLWATECVYARFLLR